MGGRGAFVNINKGDFSFVENGQSYSIIGEFQGVKVIQRDFGSVKAPDFSHSKNSKYAVVQNGRLKHLVFYDESHKQHVCIDFLHKHGGLAPHKHLYLNHKDKGIPLSKEEESLALIIKRRFGLL